MYSVRYGGKKGRKLTYSVSSEYIAVRTAEARSLRASVSSRGAHRALGSLVPVAEFAEASVSVLRTPTRRGAKAVRDSARAALKKEAGIRFAGRVLRDPKSGRPILYTENLFVRFAADAATGACKKVLQKHKLSIKREWKYRPNTFFVGAAEGTGLKTFDIAEVLLGDDLVELCHPELIREKRSRGAFARQWHLKKTKIGGRVVDAHARVEEAWSFNRGKGITIAVIDDGVDVGHEEFAGAGKIVSPRDVTRQTNDARPVEDAVPSQDFPGDAHGTACAGVACANGKKGASGVAPEARLMPIRFASGLGSQAEHDAFIWAADHGADIISCSWGPQDGAWWDPSDPVHRQVTPLPDSTRVAIDYALEKGRGGKGCVITWAAGNGNESVDNDGYASYDKVIAVAACNDRGKRSHYSDVGKAIWCAFPSNDFDPPKPLTPGIWTTDRTGKEGYNPQFGGGDENGKYTETFGGTSSACPGVAGVAALVLAQNPDLTPDQVKEVLRKSCGRIDPKGGKYDANGHSRLYGYGRVNARRAVELAKK